MGAGKRQGNGGGSTTVVWRPAGLFQQAGVEPVGVIELVAAVGEFDDQGQARRSLEVEGDWSGRIAAADDWAFVSGGPFGRCPFARFRNAVARFRNATEGVPYSAIVSCSAVGCSVSACHTFEGSTTTYSRSSPVDIQSVVVLLTVCVRLLQFGVVLAAVRPPPGPAHGIYESCDVNRRWLVVA